MPHLSKTTALKDPPGRAGTKFQRETQRNSTITFKRHESQAFLRMSVCSHRPRQELNVWPVERLISVSSSSDPFLALSRLPGLSTNCAFETQFLHNRHRMFWIGCTLDNSSRPLDSSSQHLKLLLLIVFRRHYCDLDLENAFRTLDVPLQLVVKHCAQDYVPVNHQPHSPAFNASTRWVLLVLSQSQSYPVPTNACSPNSSARLMCHTSAWCIIFDRPPAATFPSGRLPVVGQTTSAKNHRLNMASHSKCRTQSRYASSRPAREAGRRFLPRPTGKTSESEHRSQNPHLPRYRTRPGFGHVLDMDMICTEAIQVSAGGTSDVQCTATTFVYNNIFPSMMFRIVDH